MSSNLVFLGLIFLLYANGTITLTQALILAALITTVNCCNLNCNNGCNNNAFNFNNSTST